MRAHAHVVLSTAGSQLGTGRQARERGEAATPARHCHYRSPLPDQGGLGGLGGGQAALAG